MQAASFEEVLEQILAKDPRYPRNAYLFVREGLDHTQKMVCKQAKGGLRHVTGQELLGGLRELALEQFGPMAMTVLEEWGIHSCQDFGEIVFNLVEHRVLARTEQDSRADFQNGYDFYEAFRKPFLPQSKTKSPGELPQPKATEA
jgi:uncharacterized repeat protein (TIGR04138 family)